MNSIILTGLACLLALLPLVSSTNGVPSVAHDSPHYHHLARDTSVNKTVIVQMFEWNWDSIASECTFFIGPAGYGYVQVSPPQEHITGDQWWTSYQAVSYTLTSKRGNRDQFANMTSTCHAAGVKVIVDILFNHMAGINSGTGVAGSSFSHYNYPGIYQNQDFHHCGLEPGDQIVNFSSRAEIQTCQLANLADLATETEYVRGRLAQHANDVLSLGVDGFRLDAAKHMAASDIENILSRLHPNNPLYVAQEVVAGGVQPSEYVGNGEVQEFRYSNALKSAFAGGDISKLRDLDAQDWVKSSDANVFVANHDSERGGDSLNAYSQPNTYVTATIFSLAHPYGRPTILSSYAFTNKDAGAPNGGAGSCFGEGGTNGWFCQHRWKAIAGMVGFRNIVGSAGLTNWVSPQASQIAFGRGPAGFVAINNADSPWTADFATSLPDGVYCDVITGRLENGACKGLNYIVSKGSFHATVSKRNATAIHVGAKLGVSAGTSVTSGATHTFVSKISGRGMYTPWTISFYTIAVLWIAL